MSLQLLHEILPALRADYLRDRGAMFPLDSTAADLELAHVALIVQFRRQARAKCAWCHHRRVLYRIHALMDGGVGETEARCLPCWEAG